MTKSKRTNGKIDNTPVDVSKIKVGEVYKSYRALCLQLGEDIKRGNSQEAQLKRWSRYFSHEKEKGYSVVITSIFEVPELIIDKRVEGGNTISYLNKIEKLILDLLAQEGIDGELFISRNKLLEKLNIVNRNYSFGKYNLSRLSKHIDISKNEIEDFYETTDGVLKRNIERALDSLESKALLMWGKSYTIAIVETNSYINENMKISATKTYQTNQYGDQEVIFDVSKSSSNLVHRQATKKEKRNILYVQKEVMKEYGYENDYDCYSQGKAEEFYGKINNILFEKYNIHMYYYSYEILYNDGHVEEERQKLEDYALQEGERIIEMIELNGEIIERLTTNVERRHIKALKKFIETRKNKYKIRLSDDYLENSINLINLLILFGVESIEKKK